MTIRSVRFGSVFKSRMSEFEYLTQVESSACFIVLFPPPQINRVNGCEREGHSI